MTAALMPGAPVLDLKASSTPWSEAAEGRGACIGQLSALRTEPEPDDALRSLRWSHEIDADNDDHAIATAVDPDRLAKSGLIGAL